MDPNRLSRGSERPLAIGHLTKYLEATVPRTPPRRRWDPRFRGAGPAHETAILALVDRGDLTTPPAGRAGHFLATPNVIRHVCWP